MSHKPALDEEDEVTLEMIRDEIRQNGLIHCSEFSKEEVLVEVGISAASRTQMKKQSALERDKGKSVPGDKSGKAAKSAKVAERSLADQTGGSGDAHVLSLEAAPTARPGANTPFRLKWGVKKDDCGLDDTWVACEIISKSRLHKDRLRILQENHKTAEAGGFSALYQTQTSSEEKVGRLEKDKASLETVVAEKATIERLTEELRVQKELTGKAIALADKQRGKFQSKLDDAVKAKEDELIDLSLVSFRDGFDECKSRVRAKYQDLDLDDVLLPAPEEDNEEGQGQSPVLPALNVELLAPSPSEIVDGQRTVDAAQ
ncbi:uncharacterized protein LOC143859538 [Tasmannia lanceolata]|uniref:uncharacterized protein LOC143859538 n=1 Tax=Tasmannia lanceolata TaxID=3420 RepID=UPI004063DD8B